jgi:hypothetical protein
LPCKTWAGRQDGCTGSGVQPTFPTVTRKSGDAMVTALQANAPLSAAKA